MKTLLTALAVCIGTITYAQSDLRELSTADQARAWAGVGRLEIKDRNKSRFCSGALIAPNLVLTAAHCVVSQLSNSTFEPESIQFLAGWRDGRASAYGRARRVVVNPAYSAVNGVTDKTVATDLAVVELAVPMNANGIRPFQRQRQPSIGQGLVVVSYAHDRADAPSIQEECRVLRRTNRVITSSCSADFGASGAPIFVLEDGIPKIASVVSAKGRLKNGKNVSLGVSLEEPLEDLLLQLKETSGVFQTIKPGASLSEQLGRNKR